MSSSAVAPITTSPMPLPDTLTLETPFRGYCRDEGPLVQVTASVAAWVTTLAAVGIADRDIDVEIGYGADVHFTCTMRQAVSLIDDHGWDTGLWDDLRAFWTDHHGVDRENADAILATLRALQAATPPTAPATAPA